MKTRDEARAFRLAAKQSPLGYAMLRHNGGRILVNCMEFSPRRHQHRDRAWLLWQAAMFRRMGAYEQAREVLARVREIGQ